MIVSTPNASVVHHIEIKAYLDDYHAMSERLRALTNSPPLDRVQNDTFFRCRSGRLKLRSSGEFHDLIYYHRENDYGPTESCYQTAPTEHPAALRTSLVSAFGEAGQVKKFRRSFVLCESLVHLDKVAGLGNFIEIKTKLTAPNMTQSGVKSVEKIMQILNIDLFQLVDGAYIDLINERSGCRYGN